MPSYNPLAQEHVTSTGVRLEDGRDFWVLTAAGVRNEKHVRAYMETRGYAYTSATVTTETELKIFYGWVKPLPESP